MEKNKRHTGKYYEDIAAEYLEKQGLKIISRNYRCYFGEIDLIVLDKEYLVFVEVKYRRTLHQGNSLSAVDYKKQRVISKVARHFLMMHAKSMNVPCRFDVIGIDGNKIKWIKNAFDFCG